MSETREIKQILYYESPSTWYIREAVSGDAYALMTYSFDIAREPYNNTSLRRSLISDRVEDYRTLIESYRLHANSLLLLAIDHDCLAGQVRLNGSDHPFTTHVVELSINVRAAYRGKGVGSALTRCALDWARRHGGIHRVELEVLARNEDARRLYERHGFQVEGLRQAAYFMFDEPQPEPADAYMMSLRL
jgi:RimJ/RimL family protein N-acetyltransferase